MSGTTRGEPRFPLVALLALAAAMFISMTSEFLPGGLIPLISDDLGVSVSQVGLLVTVFAGIVVATTIPVAWLTRRVSRKSVVVGALAGIGAATLLAAAAPTFEILMLARVFGGLAHGLFWSVAAAYAAHLVTPDQIGRATAVTAAGGSLAGILGTPMGNLLGHLVGWRLAFVAITALSVVVVILIALLLPAVEPERRVPVGSVEVPSRRDPSLGRIAAICAVIVVVVVGGTTYATFSVVWLLDVARLPAEVVPLLLSASGIAGFVGLAITSRFADRHPRGVMLITIGVFAAVHVVLPSVAGVPAAVFALVLVAGLTWGTVPTLLQAMNMRVASPRARGFAAALQTTAFNVGIGSGAAVGGLAIDAFGLPHLPAAAGAVLVAAAAAIVLLYATIGRRPMTEMVGE